MPRTFSRTLIALIITISNSAAQDKFIFEHSTCEVRVKHSDVKKLELQELLTKLLKGKKYIEKPFIQEKKVLSRDLYVYLSSALLPGKLYKECEVDFKVKLAKTQRPTSTDRIIFSRKSKRSLPRITFKGLERCRRALKDIFIHIPYCRPIGYAGEKR